MLFDIDKTTALVVLWGATVLLLGWTWFPAIVAAMGGTRCRLRAIERTEDFPPDRDEPDLGVWLEQVRNLGYSIAGTGVGRVEYLESEWRIDGRFRLYYSPQKYTFVLLQKMPDPWNFWREVLFVTRLTDGLILITRNLPVRPSEPESGVLEQGLESFDLSEVEALHLETLDSLRKRGLRPDADNSVDGLMAALEAATAPGVKRISQQLGKKYLALHFIIHGCISLPAGYFGAKEPWALPLTNLILCLIMRIGESAQRRQIAYANRMRLLQRLGLDQQEQQTGPKG
jgi:hypothetical protein